MTIKQMRYALAVARFASVKEAARNLFISQPSLSESIRKLEDELGFDIFIRNRTGIEVTPEGEIFITQIQSVVDQVDGIEKNLKNRNVNIPRLSVSVIHYFFMTEVFCQLINDYEAESLEAYELRLLDGGTLEVMEEVMNEFSDVGIISYTEHNKAYIMRELHRLNLVSTELLSIKMCAFIRGGHPLAGRHSITMKDLEAYPYASIWQNKSDMFYFTEEGIFLPSNLKKIYVRDSGAMRCLLKDTDAFAMGAGFIPSDVNEQETIAITIEDAPITSICWIRRAGKELSPHAVRFLNLCSRKLTGGNIV